MSHVVSPTDWQGEHNCSLGPFGSQAAAEAFLGITVDFGHYESFHYELVRDEDGWYAQVRKRQA